MNKSIDMPLTRGERNHNPMNIRLNKNNHWVGKVAGNDKEFETFSNDLYGIRAGIIILRTYYLKYKICTIAGLIRRYAPESENDTENYIDIVCQKSGLQPDVPFDWNIDNVTKIIQGMIKAEIGKNYTDVLIKMAWNEL